MHLRMIRNLHKLCVQQFSFETMISRVKLQHFLNYRYATTLKYACVFSFSYLLNGPRFVRCVLMYARFLILNALIHLYCVKSTSDVHGEPDRVNGNRIDWEIVYIFCNVLLIVWSLSEKNKMTKP